MIISLICDNQPFTAMEYKLSVFDRFQCLGADCPDTCCQRWQVVIDPETMHRWNNHPDQGVRDRLLQYVKQAEGKKEHIINFNEDGYCPALTAAGTCGIQNEFGEDMMAQICRSYPRISARKDNRTVISLLMSCPQVARMVLEDQDPATVIHDGQGSGEDIHHYLFQWSRKILNKQKYAINVRVATLAKLLADLAVASSKGELNQHTFTQICNSYQKQLKQFDRGKTKPEPEISASFWSSVYSKIKDPLLLGGNRNQPSDLLRAFIDGEGKKIHREIAKSAANTHLNKLRPHLNRYLHTSLYNAGFPLMSVEDNHVASFLNGMLPFAMVTLLLRLSVSHGVNPDLNHLTRACYQTDRWVRHNDAFTRNLANNPDLLRLDLLYPVFLDL